MPKDEPEEMRLGLDEVNMEAYLALELEKESIHFTNKELEELRAATGMGEDPPAGADASDSRRTSGKAAFRTPLKNNTTPSPGGPLSFPTVSDRSRKTAVSGRSIRLCQLLWKPAGLVRFIPAVSSSRLGRRIFRPNRFGVADLVRWRWRGNLVSHVARQYNYSVGINTLPVVAKGRNL